MLKKTAIKIPANMIPQQKIVAKTPITPTTIPTIIPMSEPSKSVVAIV